MCVLTYSIMGTARKTINCRIAKRRADIIGRSHATVTHTFLLLPLKTVYKNLSKMSGVRV